MLLCLKIQISKLSENIPSSSDATTTSEMCSSEGAHADEQHHRETQEGKRSKVFMQSQFLSMSLHSEYGIFIDLHKILSLTLTITL